MLRSVRSSTAFFSMIFPIYVSTEFPCRAAVEGTVSDTKRKVCTRNTVTLADIYLQNLKPLISFGRTHTGTKHWHQEQLQHYFRTD